MMLNNQGGKFSVDPEISASLLESVAELLPAEIPLLENKFLFWLVVRRIIIITKENMGDVQTTTHTTPCTGFFVRKKCLMTGN